MADRLRSALLTSLSHDLKTPLSSIMGAAGTLKDYDASLPPEDRSELLTTVLDESDRLNRFIKNLLDMTQIESGAMEPNASLYYVGDVVGTVLRRADKILAQHDTDIHIPSDLPMIRFDPVLFEQVLFNLLDNAAKYAPEGSTIAVGHHDGTVVVRVSSPLTGPAGLFGRLAGFRVSAEAVAAQEPTGD